MQIIPVLDLLEGVVVRGVAGQRDAYRPIVSRIASSPEPLVVARAFREQFGLTNLYVADLDAILHGRINGNVYAALLADGFQLLVDAGVRDTGIAARLLQAGVDSVVVGLETCAGPQSLDEFCRCIEPERLVFSLDLKAGVPLGDLAAWGTSDPERIASQAVASGIRRLIVLDLAQVGVGGGLSTLDLCRRLLDRFPDLRLITGGGVRHGSDLKDLKDLGIEGVLVASALHDGSITRADL